VAFVVLTALRLHEGLLETKIREWSLLTITSASSVWARTATGPAEDRVELALGPVILGRADGRDFAHTVRRLADTSVASCTERSRSSLRERVPSVPTTNARWPTARHLAFVAARRESGL
jgi:hypothetical protein